MAAFNYQISTTGDCTSSLTGIISILPYGGTPPYTVEWQSPNLGVDTITLLPSVRTGLSGGTYALRLNDSTIPVNQEFYVNIPVSNGVCCNILGVVSTSCNTDNGSVTGTSTSNYSSTNFYLFDYTNTYITSGTTNTSTIVFGNLSASTYYLIAQDLGGCTGQSQTFIIEESEPFDFGLYIVPNSSCGGTPIGKIYVTGQTGVAPYSYYWSGGQTGSTVTGLTAGNYSVQVIDSLGCSKTESALIEDVPSIGFGIFTATPPSCFASDGVINLTITGGTAPYYYSASTGFVEISYSKTFSLSGLSSGQYNFLVTDSGLCTIQVGTTLNTPQGITSVNISTQNSTCSSTNGSITAAVIGGTTPYTYTLINPEGNTLVISTSQATQVFSNLESGTYTISVQDANGCVFIQETTIIAENKFTISTSTTPTTCAQNNGIIEVTRTIGGTAPFDFSLDGVINIIDTNLYTVTFTNVASGQHTITVTDAVECAQTTQVYVSGSSIVDFTLYSTSCGNGSDGTITALITSGVPPFSFDWSDNVDSNPQQIQVSNLTAGTYSLTVIDSNSCSLYRTVSIDCSSLYTSYQTYAMGCEVFQVESPSKYGLPQMLNEGFFDLTSGNTNCDLISAIFTAKVSVEPLGTIVSQPFYTATTLSSAPSDNLWYDEIQNILLGIPGIGSVTIDALNNQITITTSTINPILNNQEIIIELIIIYDIMCLT